MKIRTKLLDSHVSPEEMYASFEVAVDGEPWRVALLHERGNRYLLMTVYPTAPVYRGARRREPVWDHGFVVRVVGDEEIDLSPRHRPSMAEYMRSVEMWRALRKRIDLTTAPWRKR